jgi:hypothetical protein
MWPTLVQVNKGLASYCRASYAIPGDFIRIGGNDIGVGFPPSFLCHSCFSCCSVLMPHRHLRCWIVETRQHVITFSALKFGAVSLTLILDCCRMWKLLSSTFALLVHSLCLHILTGLLLISEIHKLLYSWTSVVKCTLYYFLHNLFSDVSC